MVTLPTRSQIKKGLRVSIETKENQGSGTLTDGIVDEILTFSDSHPHGIKVRLQDGRVGRVKNTGKNASQTSEPAFENLDEKEIPKNEDKYNEFKEFYQYDKKLAELSDKQAVEGIKNSVRERLATAVCSFGNDIRGGFVYLGIRSDGTIAGLEKDKELGEFSDYDDSFANNIRDGLGKMLDDKVFITSKLQIRFRDIDTHTICIIQVLPSNQPLYIHSKQETFYVRGPAPRAEKLGIKDQFRYIKERFPNYG